MEFYSSFLPGGLSKSTKTFHVIVIVPCVVLREIFGKYISTNTAFRVRIPIKIDSFPDSKFDGFKSQ